MNENIIPLFPRARETKEERGDVPAVRSTEGASAEVTEFVPAGGHEAWQQREHIRQKGALIEAGLPVDDFEIRGLDMFDLEETRQSWLDLLDQFGITKIIPDTKKDLYEDRSIVYESTDAQMRMALLYYYNEITKLEDDALFRNYYEEHPIIGLYLERIQGESMDGKI